MRTSRQSGPEIRIEAGSRNAPASFQAQRERGYESCQTHLDEARHAMWEMETWLSGHPLAWAALNRANRAVDRLENVLGKMGIVHRAETEHV